MALGEMGGDEVIDLFRRMPDKSRLVTAAMVQAAASMGTDAAEAFLLELARSEGVHGEVRAAALGALQPSGDEERQAMLMEILAGGDPASAAAAAQVLGRSRANQAVSLLVEVARSGSYQTSSAALSALGEIGSAEAVRALGEMVTGGPQQLSQTAVYALAGADTPEARAILMKAARTPGGDRSTVLSALTQLGGPEVEKLLLEVAKTGDLRDRQTALQHLIQTGHPDAAAMVTELATTGSRQQRQTFLYMLSQVDDPAARESLWTMAQSSSGYTRIQALEMLSQANPGDPKITSLMVDLLQNGKRDEAGMAAYSLARTASPEGRDALLAALSGGDRQIATAALNAAGQMVGDPEMAGAIAQAARSSDPQLRQMALTQLVSNRLPEGMRLAEEMLKSGRTEEATQAIQALTYAGTPESQRLVREAVRQGDTQVRALAASALAQATDPASNQALIELSRDRDQSVRAAALSGLGQVGSTEAVGVLIDAARRGETADRQAAIQALSYTDDKRAAGLIVEMIGSSDPELAAAAIGASYNAGREVDQALIAALSSEHAQVRTTAAYQLRGRGGRMSPTVQQLIDAQIGPESR
jgi:HEAT repeat protein